MVMSMRTSRLKRIFSTKILTLLILLAVLIAFFGITVSVTNRGSFFSLINIRNILNTMVIVAFLTIGASCLIISGNIDLSAGFVGTLCGMVLAFFLDRLGIPWPLALAFSIILGMVFGFINAFLVNELGLQAFIVTLSTGAIAEGLTYLPGNSSYIKFENNVISWIGNGRIANVIPVSIILAFAMFLVYGIIIGKTKFGRNVYLIGGNPNAARLAGINAKRISYILFMNASGMAAIAGCVLAGRMKSGTLNGIQLNNFAGVTAAILGGVSFGGGSGNMGGAFIGLLILNVFNNGALLLGMSPYWQLVASGGLLLLALISDYIAHKNTQRKLNKAIA